MLPSLPLRPAAATPSVATLPPPPPTPFLLVLGVPKMLMCSREATVLCPRLVLPSPAQFPSLRSRESFRTGSTSETRRVGMGWGSEGEEGEGGKAKLVTPPLP